LNDHPARGIILMLTATAIFACMDAMSKYLAGVYAVPQILFIRFVIFVVFALVIARPRSIGAAFRSKYPVLQIVRSLVITVEVGVFILAFRYLPLADTHAIAGVAPLMVTALAIPFLGEQIGIRRWTAVGIGFLGLLVIIRPGFAEMQPTMLIPILGAFLWALYQILVRKVSDDHAATSLFYMAVIGLAVTSMIVPFYWRWPEPFDWFLLVLLGGVASTGHFLMIKAFQHAPAAVLQPFQYAVLIWATGVGYVVFGDFPDAWTLFGGAIIVASGIYTFYRERVRRT
jgi:drug/metabolite transporter (DMT)-like permease